MKMLKSADLEGRGFQKEEFRKMLSTGNRNSSAYTTTLYYFNLQVHIYPKFHGKIM